jgi:6-phosphogluconolactonase
MRTKFAILCLTLSASIAGVCATGVRAEPLGSNVATSMTRVYISTCMEHGGDGIYLAELDHVAGELRLVGLVAPLKKASFLAVHPNHRFLYSTCEVDDSRDSTHGAVSAFKIDAATGNLTPLNHQSSTADGPHYLSIDGEGTHVFVANYHGGGVAVLPIDADGKLRPATSTVLHHGSSVNKNRQTGPHPHAIDVDPTNRFVFVCDLGLDKVMAYRFNGEEGTITANRPGELMTLPGSGPRHIAFHPNGKWAYVINELDSTLSALRYDSVAGAFTKIETVSTLPVGGTDENLTGEVAIHPNGKFVYASNRGHDSIAAFAVDETSGRLRNVGYYPAGGRTPRNCNIDPYGKFMLSANLDSDSITVLRIDLTTGKLSPTPQAIKVLQPYCIVFCPLD